MIQSSKSFNGIQQKEKKQTKNNLWGSSIKQVFYSNMCSILSPERKNKVLFNIKYKYQMHLDPPPPIKEFCF